MSESTTGVRKLNSAVPLAVLIKSAGVEGTKSDGGKALRDSKHSSASALQSGQVTGLGKSSADSIVWRLSHSSAPAKGMGAKAGGGSVYEGGKSCKKDNV